MFFIRCLLGCGLRRAEALALTWDNVNLENGTLYVKQIIQHLKGQGLVLSEPKSKKSRRIVVMPDFVKQALTEHKQNHIVESEYVFCTSVGTPFYPRKVVRPFKKPWIKLAFLTTSDSTTCDIHLSVSGCLKMSHQKMSRKLPAMLPFLLRWIFTVI